METARGEKKLNDSSLFDGDFRVEILENNSVSTSICVKSYNTVVFAVITKTDNIASRNKLRVKYIERYSAAGSIPKTYNLQENINNSKSLIIENYIQHQLKPLKIQTDFGVDITLLLESCDRLKPSDILTMNAAMLVAFISGIISIPYYTGRIAFLNSEVLSPSFPEISTAKFALLFCAGKKEIYFLELEANYFTGFRLDLILKKFSGRFSSYFSFAEELKENCKPPVNEGLKSQYITALENSFVKFDDFFESRAELFNDLFESQIYSDRLNKISRISGMLYYEFYSLLHSSNFQYYFDENEQISIFYNYIYKYIIKTVRAKLESNQRFYCDIQANDFKPYNIFMHTNENTAIARLFRGNSESVISITELLRGEKSIETKDRRRDNIHSRKSSNIEKYFRVDDNVENRKHDAYYGITNVFGNIINTLLGESIKSDEYKSLRTMQLEKIIRPFGEFKKDEIKKAVDRIVFEQLSTDGSEVSETATAFYFLKNWVSDYYINRYLPEDYICFEAAYLNQNNFYFFDPVFFEEHSADARFCIAGSGTKTKYLSMFCNNGGIELSKIGMMCDVFSNLLKKTFKARKAYLSQNKKNPAIEFKIG